MAGSCAGSRKRHGALAQLILCTGALLLAASPSARAQEVGSFYTAVSSNDNLSTLKAAIEAAGLVDALSDPTLAYTVFAPTNDAFAAALQALQVTAEELLSQPQATLQSLILYHALDTVVESANVPEAPTEVTTVAGPGVGPLTVQRNGSAVTVAARGSTANVVAADVGTGAGVVHVVDAVLLPFYTTLAQAVASNPELSFLEALLESTGITDMLADPALTHTLLAPSDAAFARSLGDLDMDPELLLEDAPLAVPILFDHVLEERWLSSDIPAEPTTVETFNFGRSLTAQATSSGVTFWSKYTNTTVVEADIPIGLGPKSVLHVMDRALLPYYRTVLDVTAARTDLNIFVRAVVAEGTYTSVATGETPFGGTIFAPTDDAFTALLSALGLTADELLADKDTLKRVLETHIVPDLLLTYDDLFDAVVPLTAINGQPLTAQWTFELDNPLVKSLASRAFVVDQEGTPRISVMVIDNVLLPGTPSSPAPPGYGGYGGYGYGGYGPYGYVPSPPPYGGYGSY